MKKHHPQKPILSYWIIWLVEVWERFGYYAVFGVLSLYFVNDLGYSQDVAIKVFGCFAAFSYGFLSIGGYLGDKVIGSKRMIIIGGAILATAYIFLAFSSHATVFYALGMIVLGNALFKANPSSLISKLFKKGRDQQKLDSAMTLYYMAINIGSLGSLILGPLISTHYSYSMAFLTAGCGLGIGLFIYLLGYHKLKSIPSPVDDEKVGWIKSLLLILGMTGAVLIFGYLLDKPYLVTPIVWTVSMSCFAAFIFLAFKYKKLTRDRMLVALLLILSGVIFFAGYNQMPTTLTFIALNSVDRHIGGFVIPAGSYQALNSLTILIMSPIFYKFIYPRWNASHAEKFSIGFMLMGLAFGLMFLMHFFNDGLGHVSNFFLIGCYYLQSTAELLISGLGLAMVSELCPASMSGFVMGLWFVSTMLAGPVGAFIGGFTTCTVHATNQQHLMLYANTFGIFGLAIFTFAVVFFLCRHRLNRIIGHGQFL